MSTLQPNDTNSAVIDEPENTTLPQTPTTIATDGDDGGDDTPVGAIVGGVVGAVVVIVVVIVVVLFIIRRRRLETPIDDTTGHSRDNIEDLSMSKRKSDGEKTAKDKKDLASPYSLDPTSKSQRIDSDMESSEFYGLGIAPPVPGQQQAYDHLQFKQDEDQQFYTAPQEGPPQTKNQSRRQVPAVPNVGTAADANKPNNAGVSYNNMSSSSNDNRDSLYGNAEVLKAAKAASVEEPSEVYINTQDDEKQRPVSEDVYLNEPDAHDNTPTPAGTSIKQESPVSPKPAMSPASGDPAASQTPGSVDPELQSYEEMSLSSNATRKEAEDTAGQDIYVNEEEKKQQASEDQLIEEDIYVNANI